LKKLTADFYLASDVVSIAKSLLGKVLVTRWVEGNCAVRIVETEAYAGETDRASHAFGGRRTGRTEVMYAEGGRAYVYLCYGIHHLCNVVTNKAGIPHAVLLRAGEPFEGVELMARRTGKSTDDPGLTSGPGNLSRALGIQTIHSGMSYTSDRFFIADDGFVLQESEIISGVRIGVDYAGEDARLPYRFFIRGNAWISARNKSLFHKKIDD
jgi:DNA-3-methyladenine glycosylase